MAAPELYPFSTQDGRAIPVEIVRPLAMVAYTMVANIAAGIVIPAGFGTCMIYATANCILRLSGTALPNILVNGTEYSSAMLIPSDCPTTVLVTPGSAQVLAFAAGSIYICSVQQWAAMQQDQQSRVG